MKRTLLAFAVVATIAGAAPAQPPQEPSRAFSGRIEAGAAFVSTTDQLFARGDRHLDDLNGSGDRSSAVLPLVLFDLRYRSRPEGPEVFLGTPLETDAIGLTLGLGHELGGFGTLEVAAIANPWAEVWDDPYRTDGRRDRTWARQYGGRLGWSGIGGTGAELSYTGLHTRVADDAAGGRYEALRRSGWSHELAAGYRIPVGPGLFLTPTVSGVLSDLQGDAEASTGFQGGLAALWMREKVVVNLSLATGWAWYCEEHPLFGQRREDSTLGGSAIVTLPGLFGVPRLFADVVAAYEVRDSNLKFFDADTALGAVALGYAL